MDGSRFANALSSLGVTPKELSWQCGVNVLCLGGAKNGLAAGEAVIFFNKALAADFAYRCKQAGQLLSKMRFISAPWAALLKSGSWLKNASHANRCASLLERRLLEIPGVKIMFPRDANACFVQMPEKVLDALRQKGWHFYTFIGVGGARFMCGWDTTEASIEALITDIKAALN
jgi:threonine aldolase